jgi:hypothetical protein
VLVRRVRRPTGDSQEPRAQDQKEDVDCSLPDAVGTTMGERKQEKRTWRCSNASANNRLTVRNSASCFRSTILSPLATFFLFISVLTNSSTRLHPGYRSNTKSIPRFQSRAAARSPRIIFLDESDTAINFNCSETSPQTLSALSSFRCSACPRDRHSSAQAHLRHSGTPSYPFPPCSLTHDINSHTYRRF